MQELEDKILKLLAESTGNILDVEDLINTLDNSKVAPALTLPLTPKPHPTFNP